MRKNDEKAAPKEDGAQGPGATESGEGATSGRKGGQMGGVLDREMHDIEEESPVDFIEEVHGDEDEVTEIRHGVRGEAGSRVMPPTMSGKRGIFLKFGDKEVSRKDLIRYLYEHGLEDRVAKGSRGDVVRYLNSEFHQNLTFQYVWQVTSDMEVEGPGRGRRGTMIELPGGELVPRREYIRQLFQEGNDELGIQPGDRGAIMRHLRSIGHPTTYQIVYQATS